MDKIDDYISSLPDWKAKNLTLFRTLVHNVEPSITEGWKWGSPFYLLDGKMLFATAVFKAHTKYNFILNGAALNDTSKLINNGFDGKNSRSIDLKENESIDKNRLWELIVESIQLTK